MMTGASHAPREDGVRRALRKILDSTEFEATDRLRRFLAYVVEETLAGRAERIKAYSVATEVFGRDEAFDPQTDPIVRIEARRLRRALERYYLTAGAGDPIRITINKGSYVPTFEEVPSSPDGGGVDPRETAPPVDGPEMPSRPAVPERPMRLRGRLPQLIGGSAVAVGLSLLALLWFDPFGYPTEKTAVARHGPAIFVSSFSEEGDTAAFPDFAEGFTREVIVGLTRFNDLFVFGPETTFRYGGQVDHRKIAADLGVDFILAGGTAIDGGTFKVDALLLDARSGQYVWAESFQGALGTRSILSARDHVADLVARSLAQPYGVIFSDRVRDSAGKAPTALNSYECVTRFYLYWKTFRRKEFAAVRGCLEQAIEADPSYAEAFAALSLVQSDAYRFGFGDEGVDPRKAALALARQAIALAPDSARGHHALSMVLWLMNDVDGSLAAAQVGLALNPNDTELMAELGMHLAWRNEWDHALPLLDEAFARNPGQPSGYRLALFLHHYVEGRYEDAFAEAQRIDAQDVVWGHVALAMAAGALGRHAEASAALDRILAIDPDFAAKLVGELERRNIHPELIPFVADGLRRAGLSVPQDLASGRS